MRMGGRVTDGEGVGDVGRRARLEAGGAGRGTAREGAGEVGRRARLRIEPGVRMGRGWGGEGGVRRARLGSRHARGGQGCPSSRRDRPRFLPSPRPGGKQTA